MVNIFEKYSNEKIEHIISIINNLLDKKISDKEILEKLNLELKENSNLKEELLDIAKARKRAQESKVKFVEAKYFNSNDLRFSTPKDVADYRAKRLKCDVIVDLCSGIGIQSFSFSKQCKKVYAVEIDRDKVIYAKNNFPDKNIEFVQGDVLSPEIINKIKEISPDIIFCDPERLETEAERNLESIQPNIKKLIENYSKLTPNLCIELPPQIDIAKLNELGNFEAEYLSFNNKLNRLNLYFGDLKKSEISVADVSGIRIEKDNEKIKIKTSEQPLKYLYEASPAIIKAGLENEFAKITGSEILQMDKTKLLLTSNGFSDTGESKVFSKVYQILGYSDNFREIISILKGNNIGKVVLKKKVSPENYWSERKKYESQIFGKNQACLFSIKSGKKNIEIVAEEIGL